MEQAAKTLDFIAAAQLRDEITVFKQQLQLGLLIYISCGVLGNFGVRFKYGSFSILRLLIFGFALCLFNALIFGFSTICQMHYIFVGSSFYYSIILLFKSIRSCKILVISIGCIFDFL